jgi:hypothetical protein
MIQPTIPPQNCLGCGKDTDTKILCEECRLGLTRSQIQKFDKIFQRMIIELFGNECVDCGHGASSDSGELCGAHLEGKGAEPSSRYDLASAVCRCMKCHTDEHKANIPKVPAKEKLPKETQVKQDKVKKLAPCRAAGCPINSMGKGWKKPDFCFKHQ